FSSRRRHTRFSRDWSSDVCSSDLFSVFGFNLFLSHITDIHIVNLVIEEHSKRNFIPYFVFGKINVPCIINSTDHILNTWRNFIYTVFGNGGMRNFIKSYVFIFFIPPLIHISDKLIRLKGSRINKSFVFIPNLKKIIVEAVSSSVAHDMINWDIIIMGK